MKYCPACGNPYSTMEKLLDHINRAIVAPLDRHNHVEIAELEGWDLRSDGTVVKTASDLEST